MDQRFGDGRQLSAWAGSTGYMPSPAGYSPGFQGTQSHGFSPYGYPGTMPNPYNPFNPAGQPNRESVLQQVRPWVQYGLKEAQVTGVPHAMTEVAVITYLIGMGLPVQTAYQLAESWEINEAY